jgi:O-antigen/teichoic acid export membrane protein
MIISNSIISIMSASIIGLLLIFIVPLYLNYLDYEAYALIGISIVLNSFSQILDLGFHQIIMRRTSLYFSGKYNEVDLRCLFRTIEILLLLITLILFILVLNYFEVITSNLLNAEFLDMNSLGTSIILISILLILKSFYGIYRGGIQGFEEFKWISYISLFFNILRYPGGLLLLYYWPDVNKFFTFQLIISLVEIIFFRSKYLSFLKNDVENNNKYFSMRNLMSEISLSKSLTYTSIVWVLLMQLDKFILMKFLTLKEFGYFTTIMIFSTGILSMAVPFGQVVISRLTFMSLDKEVDKLKEIYGEMTQLAVLIFFPISASLAIYSWEFIFLVTSDDQVANWGQMILTLLLIGNFFSIIGSFQFYLQLSRGDLELQSKFVTISFLIYVPILYLLTSLYGVLGAALSWVLLRAITFFIWTPIIHNKYLPGMHWRWFKENVVIILIGAMLVITIMIYNYPTMHITSKISILISIFFTWFFIFIATCLSSSFIRKIIFNKYVYD